MTALKSPRIVSDGANKKSVPKLKPESANSEPEISANSVTTQVTFASTLLAFEGQVRVIGKEIELFAHLCNDSRRILNFRQSFFLRRHVRSGAFEIVAASSIPVVDREAPMMRWVEKIARRLTTEVAPQMQHTFSLPAYCDDQDEDCKTYPFREFVWTPLLDGDIVVGGFLAARENPWPQNDQALAKFLSEIYVHSWSAIRGRGRLARGKILTRKRTLLAGMASAIIAMIPVPLTALAPVEVAPLAPFIVAAPFNGVVSGILIDQSQTVEIGEPLIAFDDIRQRNEFEIADRRAAVAQARLQRVSQSAIANAESKRDLAVARAEFDLAIVEKKYAAELLSKTTVIAEQAGIAVYTDKRDWVGRPVTAGEAILEIADPTKIRFSIDLPVKESIVLHKGAKVKIFLDSDPLKPINATLSETSYQPRSDERNVLAYRLSAMLDKPLTGAVPRIGIQGTAQVQGDHAPLIYAILRRPLASLRQMTGF